MPDNGRLRELQAAEAENERLRRVIELAYGLAQEMGHDDHQALVCVLEVLEPAVRPNASWRPL